MAEKRPQQKKWGLSSADFADRAAENRVRPQGTSKGRGPLAGDLRELNTGRINWRPGAVNLELIQASPIERSLFRFKKSLPMLVWNAAALEGNTFTLPQVQTLLDGVTVGGKRIEEAEQILALSEGMELMVSAVSDGSFTLSKEMSDRIHAVVAKGEAIESGVFRGEGKVNGGGSVKLASGGSLEGDPHGEGGAALQADYTNLLASLATLSDPRARALAYFASATRSQYYFDGNKRTARIMMTGTLIQSGYEPINTPYARQEEFNSALDILFTEDDGTQLIDFLTTCTLVEPV
jgi:hypothetical protein